MHISPFVSVTKFPLQVLSRQPSLNHAALKGDSGWVVCICELWVTSYQSCLWLYMTRPQDHIIIWSWERSYCYVVLRNIITFLWVSFWLLVKNMKTTRIIDDPWIGRDGFCLRPLALNFLVSWCLFSEPYKTRPFTYFTSCVKHTLVNTVFLDRTIKNTFFSKIACIFFCWSHSMQDLGSPLYIRPVPL